MPLVGKDVFGDVRSSFAEEVGRLAGLAAAGLSEALLLTDASGRIEWVNERFEFLTGYSGEHAIGRLPSEVLVGPETDPNTVAELRLATRERRPLRREILLYNAAGQSFWANLSISPLFDDSALHTNFAVLVYDISEYKAAQEAVVANQILTEAAEYERNIITVVSQWLYAARNEEELCSVIRKGLLQLYPSSEGALYVYRHSRDRLERREMWGHEVSVVSMPPHDCWAMRRGRAHTYGGEVIDLSCGHCQGGSDAPSICVPLLAQGESIGLLYVRFPEESCHETDDKAALAERMSQRRMALLLMCEQTSLAIANVALREELHARSTADALTGLPNRRHFMEELRDLVSDAQSGGRPVSLLSLDVDHFKQINDRFGHGTGDDVLKLLAKVLAECAAEDAIVSRFGGEEFMLAPKDGCPKKALAFAEDLVSRERTASAPMVPDVTISVGVASMPDDAEDLKHLMKCADDALYSAKRAGRNQVVQYQRPLQPVDAANMAQGSEGSAAAGVSAPTASLPAAQQNSV